MINKKEIRKRRNYKVGYYTQEELIDGSDHGGTDCWVRAAYTSEDLYLGDKGMAHFLCAKKGIRHFEQASEDHNICSIGFHTEEQKWYGWSHRAIFGFEIGSIVKEGDTVTETGWTEEYLAEHPEEDTRLPVGFTAQTLDDAKKMAITFAGAVS